MVGSVQDCPFAKNPGCQKKQQAEDCFSRIAQSVLRPYSELDKPLLEKLEQHKHDLQAARRAETAKAVYAIDNDGKIPDKHLPDCQLLVSTETAEACRALEKSLGLKANSLHPTDFANEKNGYRAAVFYDQREEKYVLAFRGTNKNNLIDWKNNINNQLSTATVAEAPSYFAAGALGKLLRGSEPPIEVTGHSKGGGEAFEFLAQSNRSAATV